MKILPNIRYIALTDSDNGLIKKGDRIDLVVDKLRVHHPYALFLPPTNTDENWTGLQPLNSVHHFQKMSEVEDFITGCVIEYNTRLVLERIEELEHQIETLKKNHNIS